MMTPTFFNILFYLFFGYFIVLLAYYTFLMIVGLSEERKRWWENVTDDYPLVYFSSFTLPVSVVIPARNEEGWIRDSILSVTNLNYPQFEAIIVDDGSTDRTFEILNEVLDLKPVAAHYVKHFKDGQVYSILKSMKYPNFTVVSKSPGLKKAGAVNAGLNVAKYKFVCVIDADTILEPDSLLKVMTQVERDPDKVIGVGSYFGLVNDFAIKDGRIMDYHFSYNPLIAYQNMEYIRSFFGNRIAWSAFNAMPNVAGGFGLWRKDVIYEMGGYSTDFTCEDIEMTFRAHDYIVKNKSKGYKIMMLPYYVGWTEGPSNIKSLVSQRDRWQRVVDETVWRYRHMLFNPRYKWMGLLTMPYFLIYEVFGVFIETSSIAVIVWAWISGILDVHIFLTYFALMLLSQAMISVVSLFTFVRDQKVFRVKYIIYLLSLSLVELFWYRWLLSVAKLLGTIRFLSGYKAYDQYIRKKRVPTPS